MQILMNEIYVDGNDNEVKIVAEVDSGFTTYAIGFIDGWTPKARVYSWEGNCISGEPQDCWDSSFDLKRHKNRGETAWGRLDARQKKGARQLAKDLGYDKKITAIKLLRSFTDLGLGEAKELIEDLCANVEYTQN